MRLARADAQGGLPLACVAPADLAARGLGTLRRPTYFLDDAAVEARMTARAKACKIREVEGSMIVCDCGWHYREREASQFGPKSLADALLDRYNEHRAGRVRPTLTETD